MDDRQLWSQSLSHSSPMGSGGFAVSRLRVAHVHLLPLLPLLPLLLLPSTAHLQPHGHEAVQAAAEVEHEAA